MHFQKVLCLDWLSYGVISTCKRESLGLERSRWPSGVREVGIVVVWARRTLLFCLSLPESLFFFSQEAAHLGVRLQVLVSDCKT